MFSPCVPLSPVTLFTELDCVEADVAKEKLIQRETSSAESRGPDGISAWLAPELCSLACTETLMDTPATEHSLVFSLPDKRRQQGKQQSGGGRSRDSR